MQFNINVESIVEFEASQGVTLCFRNFELQLHGVSNLIQLQNNTFLRSIWSEHVEKCYRVIKIT